MINHRDILLIVLETIEYQADKEAFVSEFEKNILLQSIYDLIKSMPESGQELIKRKLINASKNPSEVETILKDHFSEELRQQALENAAQESITQYIQAISPTLSAAKKEKLAKVLENIGSILTEVS